MIYFLEIIAQSEAEPEPEPELEMIYVPVSVVIKRFVYYKINQLTL